MLASDRVYFGTDLRNRFRLTALGRRYNPPLLAGGLDVFLKQTARSCPECALKCARKVRAVVKTALVGRLRDLTHASLLQESETCVKPASPNVVHHGAAMSSKDP